MLSMSSSFDGVEDAMVQWGRMPRSHRMGVEAAIRLLSERGEPAEMRRSFKLTLDLIEALNQARDACTRTEEMAPGTLEAELAKMQESLGRRKP
jgi:hypothetical protein